MHNAPAHDAGLTGQTHRSAPLPCRHYLQHHPFSCHHTNRGTGGHILHVHSPVALVDMYMASIIDDWCCQGKRAADVLPRTPVQDGISSVGRAPADPPPPQCNAGHGEISEEDDLLLPAHLVKDEASKEGVCAPRSRRITYGSVDGNNRPHQTLLKLQFSELCCKKHRPGPE